MSRQLRKQDAAQIADVVACSMFLLLGCYVCWVSIAVLDAFTARGTGTGVLPMLIGIAMVLNALLVLWKLRHGRVVGTDIAMPSPLEASRAGALFVLAVATTLLMPVLGTLAALALFLLLELVTIEQRSLRTGLTTALVVPFGLYLFFELLLDVPLPSGRLGLG